MGLIAEFRIQSSQLVLDEALGEAPDVTVELTQQHGTDPQRPYLFLWASGNDFEAFESAIAVDPTVTDVEQYSRIDGETLYRMRITESTDVVGYPVWVELGADQLEAEYTDGWWHNRMRFPDREALSALEEWYDDVGVTFVLERIYADCPDSPDEELTAPQEETLRLAQEFGYFEVPRQASMADLADELDISSQAVSERLRRAHRTLISRHLAVSQDG